VTAKKIKAALDACVLFPAQIRDLFMYLAVEDTFILFDGAIKFTMNSKITY